MKIVIAGFDKIKGSAEPIPVGDYVCQIETCENQKSPDGKPYIAWSASIIDGEYKGRKLFWNTSLQEQAQWNVKAVVEALKAPFEPDGFNTEDMLGLQIGLSVTMDTYQGKEKNKVSGYFSV